jgi:hypothetical protein
VVPGSPPHAHTSHAHLPVSLARPSPSFTHVHPHFILCAPQHSFFIVSPGNPAATFTSHHFSFASPHGFHHPAPRFLTSTPDPSPSTLIPGNRTRCCYAFKPPVTSLLVSELARVTPSDIKKATVAKHGQWCVIALRHRLASRLAPRPYTGCCFPSILGSRCTTMFTIPLNLQGAAFWSPSVLGP